MPPRLIYALVWTPGKAEVVPTKKEARERMRAWKAEREDAGVHVASVGDEGYISWQTSEAIVLHVYDPATKERVEKPLPPVLTPEQVREKYLNRSTEPAERKPARRRGRKIAA